MGWHMIAYAPLINIRAVISSGARGLYVGLSLHLYPNIVYAGSDDSCEPAHMRRLA